MKLTTTFRVLYYGILASVTGGFVIPLRDIKNWKYVAVFHIYSFIMFFAPPLGLFYGIRTFNEWWIGWGVFGFIILCYFAAAKVVNFRLHRALGRDAAPDIPDQEKEEDEVAVKEKSKEEGSGEQDTEKEKLKEELQAANPETVTVDLCVEDMKEGSSGQQEENVAEKGEEEEEEEVVAAEEGEEKPREKGLYELVEEAMKSSGLPDPPPFMQETSEEVSKSGGISLSRSSSQGQVRAEIELSTVEQEQKDQPQSDKLKVELESASPPKLISAGEGADPPPDHPPTPPESQVALLEDPDLGERLQRSRSWNREPTRWSRHRPTNASFRVRRGRPVEGTPHRVPGSAAESGTTSPPPAASPPPTPQQQEEAVLEPVRASTHRRHRRRWSRPTVRRIMDLFHSYGLDVPHTLVLRFSQELISAMLEGEVSRETFERISNRASELERGHLARDHEDYSNKSIHWYSAADGGWDFYVMNPDGSSDEESDINGLSDTSDGSSSDMTRTHFNQSADENRSRRDNELPPALLNLDFGFDPPHSSPLNFEQVRRQQMWDPENDLPPNTPVNSKYYFIPRVRQTAIEVKFSRNDLEEFMDRNLTFLEVLLTTVLAVAVIPMTAALLWLDFFQQDGFAGFMLCFVATSAMFSLMKSVHPDPASPTPDTNRYTASSRAIYFVLLGSVALIINAVNTGPGPLPPLCVYGITFSPTSVLISARNAMLIIILCFPVIYTLGALPQLSTFVIWLSEQIEMFIFGGTAATSVFSSLFALARSVLCVALLWPVGYAAYAFYQCPSGACLVNMSCMRKGCPPPASPTSFNGIFSVYMGVLFAVSFHLSRSTSNYRLLLDLVRHSLGRLALKCCPNTVCGRRQRHKEAKKNSMMDPLEETYRLVLRHRLLEELGYCLLIFLVVTALSLSTLFGVTVGVDSDGVNRFPNANGEFHPYLLYVLCGLTACVGVLNHYLLPQLRKETPWIWVAHPIIRPKEYGIYEATDDAKITIVEHVYLWSLYLEKNVLYPLVFLAGLHTAAPRTLCVFGPFGAALVTTVAGMKIIRQAYGELSRQHMILILAVLFFNFDYAHLSEGFPQDYFIVSIAFFKLYDLLLKLRFIYTYIAPWNVNWSSVKHVIIQPLLIPHTPLIFFMTLSGAVFGAPINPVSASTLFILSYMRPVKFWEKDYNTKRADSSNTRLGSQLEKMQRSQDQDHYDSLYYEHLTWVLQKELCGDLHLGRWGRVTAGDFFFLTSDKLNALVHIIEYGNGFVTFQLRGLEFGGTYCHQREVEAITESIVESAGFLCCECRNIPGVMSFNSAMNQRWSTWEVMSSCYVLKGYGIVENHLSHLFNAYEYRRGYLTYLVQSIIYKLSRSRHLEDWLHKVELIADLEPMADDRYVDNWTNFNDSHPFLLDYSQARDGITRNLFVAEFYPLIQVCTRHSMGEAAKEDSFFVTLAFALSLAARRTFLSQVPQGSNRSSSDFMFGLYQMFVGDARPHERDTWLFHVIESMNDVIIPAVRMALKLHEELFSYSGMSETAVSTYNLMRDIDQRHIITHEGDRAWRNAVVTNHPSLLAIRYQSQSHEYFNYNSSSSPYKMIRLTTKHVMFRVIKVNRECVRGLWTSQQHELLFIRNDDSERGSIQNAKSVLRNMTNSSMDLPLGYPIYVSPLTTSYGEGHSILHNTPRKMVTSPKWVTLSLYSLGRKCLVRLKKLGSSRSSTISKPAAGQPTPVQSVPREGEQSGDDGEIDSLTGLPKGAAAVFEDPFAGQSDDDDEDIFKLQWLDKEVIIEDISHVHESFNLNWLKWPNNSWKGKVGKSNWRGWSPDEGMVAHVIHEWRPFHIKSENRSPLDKVMLLLEVDEQHLVLINEQGVSESTQF